jgi:signal transduction histidine kinase
METGEPHVGRETPVEFLRPDGVELEYLDLIYAPIRDSDDRVDGVMVVVSVVTQEVLARGVMQKAFDTQAAHAVALESKQAEVQRANDAKDEFLGLVSHELKTPITTILGNSELLQKHANRLDRATNKELLEGIGSEAERLHRIIENLLILARGTHGEVDSEPDLMDWVVTRIVDDHRHSFPERELRVVLSGGGAVVEAQPIQIEQVLRNLISNAEKYSDADEPIEVSVRHVDDTVHVEVGDRGIGFSTSDESKVFTPFYRSKEAEAVAAGVGIGLVVCKRIVESLGGSMRIGGREGGGAVVRFSLPSVKPEDEQELPSVSRTLGLATNAAESASGSDHS